MLILLSGKEEFLKVKKNNELKLAFKEKNPTANWEEFDFEENENIEKLTQNLRQGGGLFSQKKLIILKNPLALEAKLQKQLTLLLTDFLTDSDTIIIIFQKEGKEKKNSLQKFLKEKSKVYNFDKLEGLKLNQWIMSEIAIRSNKNLTIKNDATGKLGLIAKGNLWQLDREIEKLVSYKERGEISIEDIDLICQGEAESKIFDLIDAISLRDKTKANRLVNSLLNQGENEFYIFTMLVYQMRNLLKVSQYQQKFGFNQDLISKEAKLHPFVVKKSLAQLRNFSLKNLKDIYNLAAEIDSDTKLGKRDMLEALNYFIAKL